MTIIASAGVIIAAAALFIVLSVFAGLKEYSLAFSSFVDPDLKVLPVEGKSFFFTEENKSDLNKIKGIVSYSEIIEERIIIASEGKRELATIKGVDKNYNTVTAIDSMIAQGSWFIENSNQIVSGWGISNKLSFGVLDFSKQLTISVPKPGKGQFSSAKSIFNSINVTNVGLFDINEDLNFEYIFADINTVKLLLNYQPNQISAIELKLNEDADEDAVKQSILHVFGSNVDIKNRAQLNSALYKMLNTENLAVYLIFTLVIAIALFNVIGAIIMMILDKKSSINTLFNLGYQTKDIRRIFFLQGSLMTIVGGTIGLIIGFVAVLLQKQFSLIMITPSLAYPVAIKGINFLIVFLTISILGISASKIASSRITKKLVKK
jgi:lipoprotein-releasing system permease protein